MTEEKKTRFLDLKIPLGSLITFYGIVLTIYGLTSGPEMYSKSLGIDINLVWGVLMLVIGVVLLLAALRARTKQKKYL